MVGTEIQFSVCCVYRLNECGGQAAGIEGETTNCMTNEEIRKRVDNLDAWVAHITSHVDELHDLVVKIAIAGEEADKRIAVLAEAQTRTEKTLQAYLASQMRSNGS